MKPLTKDMCVIILLAICLLIALWIPSKGCEEKVDPEPFCELSRGDIALITVDALDKTADVLLEHQEVYKKQLGVK
jgi:hypothetical protein